jgi:hypothetical protein
MKRLLLFTGAVLLVWWALQGHGEHASPSRPPVVTPTDPADEYCASHCQDWCDEQHEFDDE